MVGILPTQLVCHKCQRNSIPVPNGATKSTKYICRDCSPLSVDEELNFDRFQFDDAGMWPDANRNEIAELIQAVHAGTQLAPRSDQKQCLGRILAGEVPPASMRLFRALERKEKWALAASKRNLGRLPRHQRLIFIAFYFAGLSYKEIADALGMEKETVHSILGEAKKKLASIH